MLRCVLHKRLKKTWIMQKANLNPTQHRSLLELLLKNKFVEKTGHFYSITFNGKEFLRHYTLMMQMLNGRLTYIDKRDRQRKI